MVLEKLGASLRSALQKVTNSLFVDDSLINELVKELQRALLAADVNVQLVFELTKKIKQRMLAERDLPGITPKERLTTIVYEELARFLGEEKPEQPLPHKPYTIMLVGLFGSGKTTCAGKLAKYYKKRGHKVAVIQTDTQRPAAYEQLLQLGKSIDVTVFGNKNANKNALGALEVYKEAESQLGTYDTVIIDSAGRDALSEDLLAEIEQLSVVAKPDEKYLVLSADVGQTAKQQAEAFHTRVKVTGVIITKMDGTAKGGGALTACATVHAPVVFLGVGEKIDDLERFAPTRFVGRLLGMGDIATLLERAKEAMPQEKAEESAQRFLEGKFNLIDLYEQMSALKNMGGIRKMLEFIPGMSQLQIPKEMLDVQEGSLQTWKYMMDSMTKEELENPDVINLNRIERIARGSGTSVESVRELLKKLQQTKKMTRMLKGGKMKSLMKKFNLDQIEKQMG